MYRICIIIHCPDECSEIVPDALESTACVVEELVGLALLEVLGTIFVDTVQITYSSFKEGQNNIDIPIT